MSEESRTTVRSVLLGLSRGVLDWFFPRHCYHCGGPLIEQPGQLFCRACHRELCERRISGTVCDVCGLPLEGEFQADALCMNCMAGRRHFDRARAFFPYGGPAASAIKSYKFAADFFLGPRLLEGALRRGWLPGDLHRPSVVVPVPLHPRRRRERGYDQAFLLARVMARHLERRLVRRSLVRARYTLRQTRLPTRQRQSNVQGAFAVRRGQTLQGEGVLLVDDVMTTGATADECARVLKRAGAARVDVLTLARTAP
jgi:ComF family protein